MQERSALQCPLLPKRRHQLLSISRDCALGSTVLVMALRKINAQLHCAAILVEVKLH